MKRMTKLLALSLIITLLAAPLNVFANTDFQELDSIQAEAGILIEENTQWDIQPITEDTLQKIEQKMPPEQIFCSPWRMKPLTIPLLSTKQLKRILN